MLVLAVFTPSSRECHFSANQVLKFRYDASLIEKCFGGIRPDEDVVKEYHSARRLYPFCVFNSLDEVPLSWTYQRNPETNQVYERAEYLMTVSSVSFLRYFPFELQLLNVKVGSDGTGKTGRVNLIPSPSVDFGIFQKPTSDWCVTDPKNAVCRMVVRNLSDKTLGNTAGACNPRLSYHT